MLRSGRRARVSCLAQSRRGNAFLLTEEGCESMKPGLADLRFERLSVKQLAFVRK